MRINVYIVDKRQTNIYRQRHHTMQRHTPPAFVWHALWRRCGVACWLCSWSAYQTYVGRSTTTFVRACRGVLHVWVRAIIFNYKHVQVCVLVYMLVAGTLTLWRWYVWPESVSAPAACTTCMQYTAYEIGVRVTHGYATLQSDADTHTT